MNSWVRKLLLTLLLTISHSAISEPCYTAQFPGFIDQHFYVVRADSLLVNPGDEKKDNMEQIPQSSIDPKTGFIMPGLAYGKWQPTMILTKDEQYQINITGNIFLTRTENVVTVSPGEQVGRYDDGSPMVTSVGDMLLISMISDGNVPFKSIGSFQNNYIQSMNGSKPSSGTAFTDFYNNYFSNSSNSEENFINLFGYCDYYNNKFDNCFHQTGKGLTITINGSNYSEDFAKYGFPSNANAVPAHNPPNIQGTSFQVKVLETGDIKLYIDPQQFPGSQLIGGYKLKIIRLTDVRTGGGGLSALIVDPSIDLNDMHVGTTLNAGNATQVGLYDGKTTITSDRTGKLWFRVDDNNYADNMGEYYIEIGKKVSSTVVASMYNNFVVPIKAAVYSTVVVTFSRTVKDPRFKSIATAASALTIILYGLFFILGMVREPQMEFVKKIIKLSIISVLISDKSWSFFLEHMFGLFIFGPDAIITAATGLGNSNPFAFLDDMLFQLTGAYLGVRIASMLAYGIIGVLIMVILILCIVFIFLAIIKMVMVYTIMMIASAFLIAIAPIFFIAMLFGQTYKYFDEWVKMLVFAAFQPTIMIISTMVVGMLCEILAYGLFSEVVCWNPAVYLKFALGIINFDLFTIKWFMPNSMQAITFTLGFSDLAAAGEAAVEMNISGIKILLCAMTFGLGVYLFLNMINYSEALAAVLFGDVKFKKGVGAAMDEQVEGIIDAIMMVKGIIKQSLKKSAEEATKGGGKKK